MVPISSNLNEEQLNAVEMILGCKGRVPYMINGPPGTGKTMTLVEVILQLYRSCKDSRILICASSNSAADHILEKIRKETDVKIRENDIFRLNAASRPVDDMKPEYMQFCFFEQSLFWCPPLQALLRYRIIISTYMSSTLLYTEGVKKGHFSHIILDEAGQASEPETIVPISNFCQKNTRDHCQIFACHYWEPTYYMQGMVQMNLSLVSMYYVVICFNQTEIYLCAFGSVHTLLSY